MPIVIQPYRQEHEPAVQEFNQRLVAGTGDASLTFYSRSVPRWLAKREGHSLFNEYFVATDGDAVRGAYALKHEQFFIRDVGARPVACYHHPLSEGILLRPYALVGGLLLRDALSREPMLYALGMGGLDRPLPKMLKSSGWKLCLLPFFFRIARPNRFLREMQALRMPAWRGFLMDLGASTGLGWAMIKAAQSVRSSSLAGSTRAGSVAVDEIDEFGDWADALWLKARDAYAMSAVRDGNTLRTLYPASDKHLRKLRVSRDGTAIGWAVVGERRQDAKFGAMHVGSILDCWGMPQDAQLVVRAAVRSLETQGVDLVVSNQAHANWGAAFTRSGFWKGPSNFVFAASRKFSELLGPFEQKQADFHLTRADGDGLPRNF